MWVGGRHLRMGTDPVSKTCSLEYRMMDKAQNPSNPKCGWISVHDIFIGNDVTKLNCSHLWWEEFGKGECIIFRQKHKASISQVFVGQHCPNQNLNITVIFGSSKYKYIIFHTIKPSLYTSSDFFLTFLSSLWNAWNHCHSTVCVCMHARAHLFGRTVLFRMQSVL
jgi:hypothetical protein